MLCHERESRHLRWRETFYKGWEEKADEAESFEAGNKHLFKRSRQVTAVNTCESLILFFLVLPLLR